MQSAYFERDIRIKELERELESLKNNPQTPDKKRKLDNEANSTKDYSSKGAKSKKDNENPGNPHMDCLELSTDYSQDELTSEAQQKELSSSGRGLTVGITTPKVTDQLQNLNVGEGSEYIEPIQEDPTIENMDPTQDVSEVESSPSVRVKDTKRGRPNDRSHNRSKDSERGSSSDSSRKRSRDSFRKPEPVRQKREDSERRANRKLNS